VSERGWLNAPALPAIQDWRPFRVVLYWLLGWLSYMTLWWTLGPDAIRALFLYLAPKP
jgi:hypothetical protein